MSNLRVSNLIENLQSLMGGVWRKMPSRVRGWAIGLTNPRFMVSVGAVITDESGRVLLFKHVFRTGNGWGIPGGFIKRGENPEDALRRELCEEARLELVEIKFARARTFRRPQQLELIYRARAVGTPNTENFEIASFAWRTREELSEHLSAAQRRLIESVLDI